MAPPTKLEYVVARSMADLRQAREWTQSDLAHRMRKVGANWTANRVTQVETLRGKVSLYDVVALSWLFEVPITRLLQGEEDIEFPNEQGSVPLDIIRDALSGQPVRIPAEVPVLLKTDETDEIRKIAKNLGLTPRLLNFVSRKLWGHGFLVEREMRAGDVAGLPKRSAQAKRGHATRALTTQITDYVEHHGIDAIAEEYAQDQDRRKEALTNALNAVAGPQLAALDESFRNSVQRVVESEKTASVINNALDHINTGAGRLGATLEEKIQQLFRNPEMLRRVVGDEDAALLEGPPATEDETERIPTDDDDT